MSKSSFILPKSGLGRRFGGRAPVIEVQERRHNVRTAKLTFWAVSLTSAAVITTVASTLTSTPLAVVIGLVGGIATGVVVAVVVLAWPVLRILWHWTAEIGCGCAVLGAYLALVEVVQPWQAVTLIAVAVGGPLALPFTRRRLMPVIWCAISRHRLRLCFAQFVRTNRHGTVPFILIARPTPAGERLWVWLRPGLALSDLETRRDKLAVACWAHDIRLTPASRRYAAFVRVDITRRNPLAAVIDNPLPHLIDDGATHIDAPQLVEPAGLDLPDVPDADVPINPDRPAPSTDRKPAGDKPTRPLRAVPAETTGDDVTDWI